MDPDLDKKCKQQLSDLYHNKYKHSTEYKLHIKNKNRKRYEKTHLNSKFTMKQMRQIIAIPIDMMCNCIKSCVKTVGIVINKTYEKNVINSIKEFSLQSRTILGSTNAVSHFNKQQTRKEEILLVFTKYS